MNATFLLCKNDPQPKPWTTVLQTVYCARTVGRNCLVISAMSLRSASKKSLAVNSKLFEILNR